MVRRIILGDVEMDFPASFRIRGSTIIKNIKPAHDSIQSILTFI